MLIKLLKKFPKYQKLISDLNSESSLAYGDASSGIQKILLVASFLEKPRDILVVYPNLFYASKAFDDFAELLSEDQVSFFPVEEFVVGELAASSSSFRFERIKTYIKIVKKQPQIIVTSTEGLMRHTMSLESIKNSFLEISSGMTMKFSNFLEQLVIRGYKKVSITENPGTFSVRGSLIDVFVIGCEFPYRVEFFDNEIETIKSFDVTTQRTTSQVESFLLYPLYELYYQKSDIPRIKEQILLKHCPGETIESMSDRFKRDFEELDNYNNLERLYLYLPEIDPSMVPFLGILDKPTLVLSEVKQIEEKHQINLSEITEYLLKAKIGPLNELFPMLGDIYTLAHQNVRFSQFSGSKDIVKYYSLKTNNNPDYNNNVNSLIEDLKVSQKQTIILTQSDKEKFQHLAQMIDRPFEWIESIDDLHMNTLNLLTCDTLISFEDYELNLRVITPIDYMGTKITKHHKYQKAYNQSVKVFNQTELTVGDYIVHREYGIGRYLGIKTLNMSGFDKDYISIEFDKDSKLYIPVENIYTIEKYVGINEKEPKLTSINSKEWLKKKEKIMTKIKALAKDMIKVQLEREKQKGFGFLPDTEDQGRFEADFGFVETKGQLTAIADVKKDMESERPMERLICGDVGFGKTEVALRAAFKAVQSGKQVAYLTPTTVLCRQQYLTFKERFEKYGARVDQLSRLVDEKTQHRVLEGLESGYVDVVVGTHRILSNDLKYHDLGLLIVDEEHRFGVAQKEKIKALKANIDVLSLSATPIPRTLQMSLSGVRELSLIDTPPVNRMGVQTYVVEREDAIVREAINRELGRGGQVFYLMNRIAQLPQIKSRIRSLVPEAKVGIIHGRMNQEEIEDVLTMFLDQEYNVLLCTTIIESGINIPNANTMIIERADTLGLAQIYQIRGRVGRSDQIAYAYLMYENEDFLSDVGRKRLETIRQFTELGSGYKIALRDLAIRGAGDVLGSEQSGFIADIGIELYLHMLNEAIDEANGIHKEESTKKLTINMPRHIPIDYVGDESLRIAMHTEIAKITSRDRIDALIMEYLDRFGQVSDVVLLYLEGKYLEFLLKSRGIESYKELSKMVELTFDQETSKKITYPRFLLMAKVLPTDFSFFYIDQKIGIKIKITPENSSVNKNNYIYVLSDFFENKLTF